MQKTLYSETIRLVKESRASSNSISKLVKSTERWKSYPKSVTVTGAWVRLLRYDKIPNPSVNKFQKLYEVLSGRQFMFLGKHDSLYSATLELMLLPENLSLPASYLSYIAGSSEAWIRDIQNRKISDPSVIKFQKLYESLSGETIQL